MNSAIVHLVDFLDARHGAGGWRYWSARSPGTDIRLALEDALDYLRRGFGRGVVNMAGNFSLGPGLNPDKLAGNTLRGPGPQGAAMIVYESDRGVAFDFNPRGPGGRSGGGIENINIMLNARAGDSRATSIRLTGNSKRQADETKFDNIKIGSLSRNSHWHTGSRVDARRRQKPQGVRGVVFNNVGIFRCHKIGFYARNVVRLQLNNVGVHAGKNTGGDMTITGGRVPRSQPNQIKMDLVTVNGTLRITNSMGIFAEGLKVETLAVNKTLKHSRINCWAGRVSGTPHASTVIQNHNQGEKG